MAGPCGRRVISGKRVPLICVLQAANDLDGRHGGDIRRIERILDRASIGTRDRSVVDAGLEISDTALQVVKAGRAMRVGYSLAHRAPQDVDGQEVGALYRAATMLSDVSSHSDRS
jgi:hypothetical protein